MFRWWAFWRRVQYGAGFSVLLGVVGFLMYAAFWFVPPTCTDGVQNGEERAVDCGGVCVRVCAFDVEPLTVVWAQSFEIIPGQYNAVAYVKNPNQSIGSPKLGYTFTLYDNQGVIAERQGVTEMGTLGTHPIFEGRISTGSRTPTRTSLTFSKDVLWLPAISNSTQFSIIKYDLASADRLPRLTAEVRNNSLDVAEEVEVIATIFDSKNTPLTASRTQVQQFGKRESESVVFTWPQPIAGTLRSCEVPTDVVLAIDLSGSMNNDSANPPEPLTSVLGAAQSFVSRLNDHDQIGIVTYATQAGVAEQLTSEAGRVAEVVKKLTIDPKEEVGNTNTGEALKRMTEELSSGRHNEDARKVAVLLTDGLATAPKGDPDAYAIEQANALKETGVQLFTVGIGASLNESFLRDLASSPTHYYKAPSIGEVDRIYSLITDAICEDGPTVIEVIPKVQTKFQPIQ
jgi:Mg-chelatase subunit ChlD